MARPDGWVDLTTAEDILGNKAPNELKTLKGHLECQTMKELLLVIEGFEVLEERISEGGVRALYRVKPEQIIDTAVI